MATKAGEIELDVRLTGDDISKTLHKISDSITKKFDSAFSSLSKDFENVSTDMKQSFSKVSEGVSQKTEKEFSNIKGSGEQLSNSVSSSFKKIGTAVVAAFSVAKIKEFGQQCIESAAEVNAANSQFEQTFGTMQSQAESAIQSVANQSGILETRLQGVGTSIYAFAKTTGMDSSSALGMMQEALQVTADSAAYYDRSLEDTAESLKSFLKGNFENDAALGLSCTETTRNAAANKLYGKSFMDLSESQKQLTLLQMVKDANQLSGAMGQASREADGWENVTGNLRESWKQLLAVVGQTILQVATQVVKRLSSALATLTEYAKGAVESPSKVFGWDTGNNTASNIKSASDSAKSLTDTADDSSKSLDNVQKSSEKAKRSVAGFDKLNVLSSSDSSSSKSDTSSSKISSGGSSGGSCAAVAAEEVPFALGSDTGGSIRQPSSFCGVTGIKPTYGTVSRYGLIAYGSSLDQIGPIAKDVTDCATILEAIASYDTKDSTSVNRDDLKFTEALVDDVKGMKIGIPKDYLGDGLDPEVKSAILAAADELKKKGAVVEEFDLGLVEYAIPAYYVIACAEASSNLARFDGVKYGYRTKEYTALHNMYKKSRSEGFGPEVKRRIMLGSFVLSSGYYDAYYLKALRVKALIKKAFDDAFAKYDVILGPAAPTTAPKLGESLSDPIQMYLGDIYTISVNLAGLPGISLPCGMDKNGLPIGLQLIGDCFKEKNIIRAAYSFEKTRELKRSAIAEEYSNKNAADTNKSAGAQ